MTPGKSCAIIHRRLKKRLVLFVHLWKYMKQKLGGKSQRHGISVGAGTKLQLIRAGKEPEPVNQAVILRRHLNPPDVGIDCRNASSTQCGARHQKQILDLQRNRTKQRIFLQTYQLAHLL